METSEGYTMSVWADATKYWALLGYASSRISWTDRERSDSPGNGLGLADGRLCLTFYAGLRAAEKAERSSIA